LSQSLQQTLIWGSLLQYWNYQGTHLKTKLKYWFRNNQWLRSQALIETLINYSGTETSQQWLHVNVIDSWFKKNDCMLIQHNGSELKFKVHILSRTRMPNSETQPSIMSHMHCICIFYIYHILIAVSFESILCLFLTTLLTSYVELFISKLTITDYHYLHFVLFLLINHFRYFVCQALDIMTLLEYPLAFYR